MTLMILLTFITIGYVNLFRFNYRMNADIASEAVLTRLIWESKEWIPGSWYPSTETKVFSMPNLAALVYGITGNMNLSAISEALKFVSVQYFTRAFRSHTGMTPSAYKHSVFSMMENK